MIALAAKRNSDGQYLSDLGSHVGTGSRSRAYFHRFDVNNPSRLARSRSSRIVSDLHIMGIIIIIIHLLIVASVWVVGCSIMLGANASCSWTVRPHRRRSLDPGLASVSHLLLRDAPVGCRRARCCSRYRNLRLATARR